MSKISSLQLALDRLLDAEPWDPVAVERARIKLGIAREEEANAIQTARDAELFLLRKEKLTASDEPPAVKALQARPRERTPPPTSYPGVLGLEAELPQHAATAGIDCSNATIEDAPLLPRLLASFRADFVKQIGDITGMIAV